MSLVSGVREARTQAPLSRSACCGRCRHFDSDPQLIESSFAGLASLSSGTASARDADGICQLRQRYLSAHSRCEQFEPA